jgi:hypothetical protein
LLRFPDVLVSSKAQTAIITMLTTYLQRVALGRIALST